VSILQITQTLLLLLPLLLWVFVFVLFNQVWPVRDPHISPKVEPIRISGARFLQDESLSSQESNQPFSERSRKMTMQTKLLVYLCIIWCVSYSLLLLRIYWVLTSVCVNRTTKIKCSSSRTFGVKFLRKQSCGGGIQRA